MIRTIAFGPFCFVFALSVGFAPVRGADLRVGVARVEITPPLGIPMAGYYHERGADGVIDPLYSKAVVIESDGVRAAWPGYWIHVRASNTEPILRVIVEGEDPERVERVFADTLFRVNTVVHGKS